MTSRGMMLLAALLTAGGVWQGHARCVVAAPQPALKEVADVPLPGSATRFDYQSFDPKSGRLYISHMGAGHLVVFDTKAQTVAANLSGFSTVTGVLCVP